MAEACLERREPRPNRSARSRCSAEMLGHGQICVQWQRQRQTRTPQSPRFAPRQTRTRSSSISAERMAAHAADEKTAGAALWEAAKEGNTAEARRLLDAGAPVDWKNAAEVSSWYHGVVPARRRAC